MAKLVFENITLEQANMLANWYEGQGEQEASMWFECQSEEIKAPITNMSKEGGWKQVKGETVTIHMR